MVLHACGQAALAGHTRRCGTLTGAVVASTAIVVNEAHKRLRPRPARGRVLVALVLQEYIDAGVIVVLILNATICF